MILELKEVLRFDEVWDTLEESGKLKETIGLKVGLCRRRRLFGIIV